MTLDNFKDKLLGITLFLSFGASAEESKLYYDLLLENWGRNDYAAERMKKLKEELIEELKEEYVIEFNNVYEINIHKELSNERIILSELKKNIEKLSIDIIKFIQQDSSIQIS